MTIEYLKKQITKFYPIYLCFEVLMRNWLNIQYEESQNPSKDGQEAQIFQQLSNMEWWGVRDQIQPKSEDVHQIQYCLQ